MVKNTLKYVHKYRKTHPERVRESARRSQRKWILRTKFGLTVEQYNEILQEQKGLCAICGNKQSVRDGRYNRIKALAIDHDPKLKKRRGLLCDFCNRGLGQFKDDVRILYQAISYLRFWERKITKQGAFNGLW